MKQISTKRVKARKEHTCDMCHSEIYVNEKYDLEVIENDGAVYNWKQCDHCKGVLTRMSLEGWYPDGISDQMFYAFISDNQIDFKKR